MVVNSNEWKLSCIESHDHRLDIGVVWIGSLGEYLS